MRRINKFIRYFIPGAKIAFFSKKPVRFSVRLSASYHLSETNRSEKQPDVVTKVSAKVLIKQSAPLEDDVPEIERQKPIVPVGGVVT